MSEGESTADREARRTRRLGPPCRRFGLLDGMIAVAASSLVVFGCRWYYNQSDSSWPYELHEMAGCCLMVASDLMLTLRLRRPRPTLRRIARQPGFVASLAIATLALVNFTFSVNMRLALGRGFDLASLAWASWSTFDYGPAPRPAS